MTTLASKATKTKRPSAEATRHAGAMVEIGEAALWSRLLEPRGDDLSEDAARSFLRMTFREEDRRRAHELTAKHGEKGLTPSEQAELETYCRVGRVLDLMHSKARLALKRLGAR